MRYYSSGEIAWCLPVYHINSVIGFWRILGGRKLLEHTNKFSPLPEFLVDHKCSSFGSIIISSEFQTIEICMSWHIRPKSWAASLTSKPLCGHHNFVTKREEIALCVLCSCHMKLVKPCPATRYIPNLKLGGWTRSLSYPNHRPPSHAVSDYSVALFHSNLHLLTMIVPRVNLLAFSSYLDVHPRWRRCKIDIYSKGTYYM